MADGKANLKAVQERQAYRAAMKQYYLSQISDPHRHGSGQGGVVFDPAVQRFMSMRHSQYDYFKPTPRSSMMGIALILPIVVYGLLLKNDKDKFEKKCRTGQISYADREFKFF